MVNLTRREKKLGIGVAAVIAVWAVYAFAIRPAQDRIHTLERIIPQKQSELADVQAKSAVYVALRDEFEDIQARIARQDPAFELLPFLETLIERHQLGGHVLTMEQDALSLQPGYAETSVTIELQGVSLRQLVDFLDAVESAQVVAQIGSLHLRKGRKDPALLDSTLQICTPRLTQTPSPPTRFSLEFSHRGSFTRREPPTVPCVALTLSPLCRARPCRLRMASPGLPA